MIITTIPAFGQTRTNAGSSETDTSGTIDFKLVFAGMTEEKQTQSVEEYKAGLLQRIDNFPVHPSQAGTRWSLTIADELFAKMQADPALEQKVMGMIEESLGGNFVVPPAFATMSFDAEGTYDGTAGGSFWMGKFEEDSTGAFWRREPTGTDKRAKRVAENAEEAERKKKKKKLEQLLLDLAVHRREAAQAAAEGVRAVASGDADYVSGPAMVMRPSIIESLTLM